VIITCSQDGSYSGRRDIVDGHNVILVNAGDVAGLRSAIDRLMTDPDLRRRVGANARKWAQEHAGRAQWLNIVFEALRGAPVSGSAAIPALLGSTGSSSQPHNSDMAQHEA